MSWIFFGVFLRHQTPGDSWSAAIPILSRTGGATGHCQPFGLCRDRPRGDRDLRRNPPTGRTLCVVSLWFAVAFTKRITIDATIELFSHSRNFHFGRWDRKSIDWINGGCRPMDVGRSFGCLDGWPWIFCPRCVTSFGADTTNDTGCIAAVRLHWAEESILGQFLGLAIRFCGRSGNAEAPYWSRCSRFFKDMGPARNMFPHCILGLRQSAYTYDTFTFVHTFVHTFVFQVFSVSSQFVAGFTLESLGPFRLKLGAFWSSPVPWQFETESGNVDIWLDISFNCATLYQGGSTGRPKGSFWWTRKMGSFLWQVWFSPWELCLLMFSLPASTSTSRKGRPQCVGKTNENTQRDSPNN